MSFRNRIAAAFVLVLMLAIFQSASAQTPQAHPVARLLSASSDPASRTRPRRVAVSPTVTNRSSLSEATEIERRTFQMINTERWRHGVAPLQWASDLYRMARTHSANMAQQAFFSHETPNGLRPRDRARAAGIRHFRVLAENIAYNRGEDDPGASAVQQWLTSPGHRANILSAEFAQSAIGSSVDAEGRVYLTQVFIAR